MRMMKTLRAAMAALLTLCVLVLPSASAANAADDGTVKDQTCSLTIEFILNGNAMNGVKFEIWRVGEKTDRGWVPLRKYQDYNVLHAEGNWSDKANTLLSYLRRDNVQADDTAFTDEKGLARFRNLEGGLYLVAGEQGVRGKTHYAPIPSLVALPHTNAAGNLETNVKASVKYNSYEEPGNPSNPGGSNPDPTVDRHVLKVWNDNGHEAERPEEIIVDLLQDGRVYDTVTLTAAGNWRYDWTGLNAKNNWMVVEKEHGNYNVMVDQSGITFRITNTWQEELKPEDPPPLIDLPEDPTPLSPFEETEILEEPPKAPLEPLEETDIPDDLMPRSPADRTDVPNSDTSRMGGDPMLPQTGQLWWPVAPMALGGLTLSTLGWKRRRDWNASDDEFDASDESDET